MSAIYQAGRQFVIPLSTFFARQVDRFSTLLRSLGLNAPTLLRADRTEPAKVVITRSRRLALARCAIHILPALISIALISLNLTGYFIGNELQGPRQADQAKLSALQIAAKVQELLIVSSLGTVIFHVLRTEVMFGEGVPAGLLVSGFSFTSLSYFYSAEFLGAIRNPTIAHTARTKLLIVIVIIGGAIALMAGPSAAVLMIPSRQDWEVGGGIFWLNGSAEQLWPTTLTADYYSDFNCVSNPENQFKSPVCPSAGFQSLRNHYSTWWNYAQSTSWNFEMRDVSLRKLMYTAPARSLGANMWSYTTHQQTANMQDAMRGKYDSALRLLIWTFPSLLPPTPEHLLWAEKMTFELESRVPAARSLCRSEGNLVVWGNSSLELRFLSFDYWDKLSFRKATGPYLEEALWDARTIKVDVAEQLQRQLFKRGIVPRDGLPLGPNPFNRPGEQKGVVVPVDLGPRSGSSLGIVFVLDPPLTPGGNESLTTNVLSCTVDAYWMKAKLLTSSHPSLTMLFEFAGARSRNLAIIEHERDFGLNPYRSTADRHMSRIRLSPDWFEIASPIVPDSYMQGLETPIGTPSTNMTAAEYLLQMFYNPNVTEPAEMENLLNLNIVDALSRTGMVSNHPASRFFHGDWYVDKRATAMQMVRRGKPGEVYSLPEELASGNYTRFEATAKFTGWVMFSHSWFDYLAIVILLTHAVIALVHTGLTVYWRDTSGAWDSILEMIVLSQISPPPANGTLDNASGGIRSYKTVKLRSWIEATPKGIGNHGHSASKVLGELRLRLEPLVGGEKRDAELKPIVGGLYGGLAIEGEQARRRTY